MNEFEEYCKTLNSCNFALDGLISFVVLGAWDSKIGPHVQNLWYPNNQCDGEHLDSLYEMYRVLPTKFLVNFVMSLLLSGGEEPRVHDENQRGFKLDANNSSKFVDNSIKSRMEKDQVVMNYSCIINHLLKVLNRLHTCSVSHICMRHTFYYNSSSSSVDRIRREFLSTAVMSHLITFGRSLVIGTDIGLINTMIRTLSIFLPTDKRALCVELTEQDSFDFSSNMMVQGLCRENLNDVDYTFWSVLVGPYPLTVVHMNTERVLQSGPLTHHLWMQNIVHDRLLSRLYCSPDGATLPLKLFFKNITINLDCILKDGVYCGDLTKTFVTKIMNTSGCRKKWDVFQTFWDSLLCKARLLILLTKKFTGYEKSYMGGDWKVSRSLLKDACHLRKDGDFMIVLAVAETLSPGIFGVVYDCPNDKIADLNHLFCQL